MFGSIGFPELIVIFTIALLIFGPKKLPEVGKSIGKALREFRKTSDEIKEKIEEEIHAEEFRDIKKDVQEITDFKSAVMPEEKDPYDLPEKDSAPTEDAQAEVTEKDSEQNGDEEKVS